MPTWMITSLTATAPLRDGAAPTPTQAWKDAIDAAVGEVSAHDGCVIVMDDVPAVLVPGRTDDGRIDVPATRSAAERMAIAAIGGLG